MSFITRVKQFTETVGASRPCSYGPVGLQTCTWFSTGSVANPGMVVAVTATLQRFVAVCESQACASISGVAAWDRKLLQQMALPTWRSSRPRLSALGFPQSESFPQPAKMLCRGILRGCMGFNAGTFSHSASEGAVHPDASVHPAQPGSD